MHYTGSYMFFLTLIHLGFFYLINQWGEREGVKITPPHINMSTQKSARIKLET